MGRSKAFIDRKQAASYNLVYRNAEAGQETSDRQWIDSSKGVGVGRPDVEAVQQHTDGKPNLPYIPRWFQDEVDEISEERRKELIELGFPDDGYDYLKHLRVLGKGQASLEGPEAHADTGPSTFVPALKIEKPDEDCKAFDARQFVLHQAAKDALEAAQSAGGVSAFSKELNKLHKPTQADVDELERLISQYQHIEDDEQGDLLDDFVLSATMAPTVVPSSTRAGPSNQNDITSDAEGDSSEDESDASSSEALSEDVSSRLGSHAAAGPRKLGSIASTYWRPERQDRKENLSVIDERFEAMALEYDSDDIGELDNDSEDIIQGPATVEQFDNLLTEFLEDHPTQDHNHEAGYAYNAAGGSGTGGPVDRAAVAKSGQTREVCRKATSMNSDSSLWQLTSSPLSSTHVQRAGSSTAGSRQLCGASSHHYCAETRALLRIAEEEEEQAATRPNALVSRIVDDIPQQQWDCESVLSLRSNLDNHPGTISEQSSRRYKPASGRIKLAAKTGLPINSSENNRTLDFDSYSRTTSASAAQPRLKGESTREKKERKAAVKEAKREARSAKKELKTMFKEEAAKQHKRMATPPSSIVPLG